MKSSPGDASQVARSSKRVVVVGSGAAGVAAAWTAVRAGLQVTIVRGGAGATAMTSGALDDCRAPDGAGVGRAPGARPAADFGDVRRNADLATLLDELGIWEVGGRACRVATQAGCIRGAAGRDRSVLDLAQLAKGSKVGILDMRRRDWCADALARELREAPWARARGIAFQPIEARFLRYDEEQLLPNVDLAERHDEPERASWLVEGLSSLRTSDHDAFLTGPWLGLDGSLAGHLSACLGKPIGEVLSRFGGTAGVRFERSRDRLLGRLGVREIDGWAAETSGGGIRMTSGERLEAEGVVLATGGLLGGGLAWRDVDAELYREAHSSRTAGFESQPASPATIGLDERPLAPGGAYGPSFEAFAWTGGALWARFEQVGLLTSGSTQAVDRMGRPLPGLFVAGAAAADQPRTLLAALRSGIRAATAAAAAL
jgi:glycerol-3-phosphate dehydrogenase subunit B